MKFVIDGCVFDSEEIPLTVVLDDEEKKSVSTMLETEHHYAVFPRHSKYDNDDAVNAHVASVLYALYGGTTIRR